MIDFHVHTLPDTFDHTVDAVEAAKAARELGMRAIVLKGGAFETVTRAAQANAAVGGSIRVAVGEGYPAFVRQLRALGITGHELDWMGRRNPAALLGL